MKITGFENNTDTNTDTTIQSSITSTAVQPRCEGTTMKGERCQRVPKDGQARCHFHKGTCQGHTQSGRSCKNGAVEGTSFCLYHAATCPGTKKDGTPCQLAKEFCRYHRAAHALARAEIEAELEAELEAEREAELSGSVPRCRGNTKAGNQCKLKPSEGEEFCHFHC